MANHSAPGRSPESHSLIYTPRTITALSVHINRHQHCGAQVSIAIDHDANRAQNTP